MFSFELMIFYIGKATTSKVGRHGLSRLDKYENDDFILEVINKYILKFIRPFLSASIKSPCQSKNIS